MLSCALPTQDAGSGRVVGSGWDMGRQAVRGNDKCGDVKARQMDPLTSIPLPHPTIHSRSLRWVVPPMIASFHSKVRYLHTSEAQ